MSAPPPFHLQLGDPISGSQISLWITTTSLLFYFIIQFQVFGVIFQHLVTILIEIRLLSHVPVQLVMLTVLLNLSSVGFIMFKLTALCVGTLLMVRELIRVSRTLEATIPRHCLTKPGPISGKRLDETQHLVLQVGDWAQQPNTGKNKPVTETTTTITTTTRDPTVVLSLRSGSGSMNISAQRGLGRVGSQQKTGPSPCG